MQIAAILHLSARRSPLRSVITSEEMTSTNDNNRESQRKVARTKGYSHESSNGRGVVEMDFFNSRYFIINKSLLRFMGLWPYQHVLAKIVIRVVFTVLIVIFIIPQFISLFSSKNDPDKAIQAAATLLYLFGTSLKFFLYIITENKIKRLYLNIEQNWKMLENKTERNILLQYSETGRLLTIGYLSYMISALFVFITMPALPSALDKISPLTNGSRPKIFILDGEFLVDKLENYRTIYFFEGFACMLTVIIFSTLDSTYAVTVEQCIGLLAVVKLRLKLATKHAKQAKSLENDTIDMAYDALVKAAKLHIKVLNFAQVLESSYSTAFLVVMACNVGILSVGSVVVLINLGHPMELFRYGLIYAGLMIHMFYLSWPGQKMIDSSGGVFYDTYNNEWYDCSLKSQKLLKFMMRRTIEPLELTCGGFYTMNFQNYGALTKTSMSYITVFASFR